MKTPAATVQVSPALQQAALEWLSLLNDAPSSRDQLKFSQWLQADPAHVEAYDQAQVLWELSEGPAARLAEEDSVALAALLRQMDAPTRPVRRPVKRWSAGLAMAACLLLAVAIGAGWQPTRWVDDLGADYVSAPGQVRTVVLADDSQVTLDADSAIAVNFSQGERHVQLRRGAAFFQVTHTGEPFRVDAHGGQTQVLGTQFEVRLQAQGAQVTVLSGRVGVKSAQDEPQRILGAAQRVAYDQRITGDLQAVDPHSQLAWRDGWLNYYRTPLADVIDDLSRYYPGRIVLLNPKLGEKRISGSFPSKDPEAVLAALKSVVGLEEYSVMGRVIFVR
jgi:transmembrane sensor